MCAGQKSLLEGRNDVGVDPSVDDRAELLDVWNRAKKRFDDPSIRPQQKGWISLTKPLGLMQDTALLAAPNTYAKDYLENNLRPLITATLVEPV